MKCLVCEEEADAAVLSVPETMHRNGTVFEYRQCSTCGSWSRYLDATDQSTLYPEQYYSFAVNPVELFSNPVARTVASLLSRWATRGRTGLLRMVIRLSPVKEVRSLATSLVAVALSGVRPSKPRILDVGSGSGVVPYVLSLSPGVTARGIDPFASAELARGDFTLTKEHLDEVGGTWDAIMFNHSLEHARNPRQLLTHAMERLAPGGNIIVRLPTSSSWAFDHYGPDWFQFDAPRHEFLPTRDGLRRLCDKVGLRARVWYDDSSDTQIWLSDMVRSGLSMLDPETSFGKFRRPDTGAIAAGRMHRRARALNRRMQGDQTSLILERA